jgi:hypothetical protein
MQPNRVPQRTLVVLITGALGTVVTAVIAVAGPFEGLGAQKSGANSPEYRHMRCCPALFWLSNVYKQGARWRPNVPLQMIPFFADAQLCALFHAAGAAEEESSCIINFARGRA